MTKQSFTIVSFHAHPDDEVLLTGGTLAKAAAEGHRVVLVVATLGERGLADYTKFDPSSLGERRRAELQLSADRLGCARVLVLGYRDSGVDWPRQRFGVAGDATSDCFADADVNDVAQRLARILIEEHADVLTSYDVAGGYGHPDHIQVHRVGARAAELAGTPILLEATIDRRLLTRSVDCLRRLRWLAAPGLTLPDFSERYSAPSELTHRINVRSYVDAKVDALRAHESQGTSAEGTRTLRFLVRLPRPIRRLVLGSEWYVEHGRTPTGRALRVPGAQNVRRAGRRPLASDPFDSLRNP